MQYAYVYTVSWTHQLFYLYGKCHWSFGNIDGHHVVYFRSPFVTYSEIFLYPESTTCKKMVGNRVLIQELKHGSAISARSKKRYSSFLFINM